MSEQYFLFSQSGRKHGVKMNGYTSLENIGTYDIFSATSLWWVIVVREKVDTVRWALTLK